MHLWAAYGKFQIVPVDLVDGPGDELLVVRVPAHSSPPIGYDLKVWKVGATRSVELGGVERVANLFATRPIGCARWRTTMSIHLDEAKPRSIALETAFGSAPCCQIDTDEIARTSRGRQSVLVFDAAGGKYVLR